MACALSCNYTPTPCHTVPPAGILTSPSVFRPAITVEGGYMYVTFDASDLTALPQARCFAVSYTPRNAITTTATPIAVDLSSPTRMSSPTSPEPVPTSDGRVSPVEPAATSPFTTPTVPPPVPSATPAATTTTTNSSAIAQLNLKRGRLLLSDIDLDLLLHVVSDQDSNPGFRAAIASTNSSASRATAHAQSGVAPALASGRTARPAQTYVVAVADDAACLLAVRVAMAIMRPGADSLHLLTIARDGSAAIMESARALVGRYRDMASATLGDVQAVAQVRTQGTVVG